VAGGVLTGPSRPADSSSPGALAATLLGESRR